MASAFNLLTAGGARFDKTRFKHDHELFNKPNKRAKTSSKGKLSTSNPSALPSGLNVFSDPWSSTSRPRQPSPSRDTDNSGSESEDEPPAPPTQKITLSGSSPLPASLHSNLPSLLNHPSHPIPSSAGKPLLRALADSGIKSLWGVQSSVSGCLLSGRDVLCVAPTGSGKTLAYVLPTLIMLKDPIKATGKKKEGGVRAVILVPTHDLGVQILGVVKAVTQGRNWRVLLLSKATEKAVCESSPGVKWMAQGKGKEKRQLRGAEAGEAVDDDEDDEDGVDGERDEDEDVDESDQREETTQTKGTLGLDILISTPERLHHLIENQQLSLAKTSYLIMDETDRLLSPDFLPQITPIVKACTPPTVQKCLLSATIPAGVEAIAKGWLRDGGVRVVVGVKDSAVSTVTQSLLFTSTESGKLLALQNLIRTGQLPYPSLIFVQSIQRADELYQQLVLDTEPAGGGVRVGVVHGAKSNSARDETVRQFREGKVWVLVVTEVMARGMDFGGVKVVVNYDFPQTVQSYIHRIGRTGRAGRSGKAITFFSNEDAPYVRTIANVLVSSGCPVPQYILDLPNPSKNTRKNLARAPVKRKNVGGGGRDLAREERRKRGEMKEGSKRRKVKGGKKGDVELDE